MVDGEDHATDGGGAGGGWVCPHQGLPAGGGAAAEGLSLGSLVHATPDCRLSSLEALHFRPLLGDRDPSSHAHLKFIQGGRACPAGAWRVCGLRGRPALETGMKSSGFLKEKPTESS